MEPPTLQISDKWLQSSAKVTTPYCPPKKNKFPNFYVGSIFNSAKQQ